MYNIVQQRKWYYIFSSIIIIPGLLVMLFSLATTGRPLKLSIDFTGGVYWEFKLDQAVPPADVRAVFTDLGLNDTAVTTLGGEANHFQARLKTIEQGTKETIQADLEKRFGTMETLQYRNVGPAVGPRGDPRSCDRCGICGHYHPGLHHLRLSKRAASNALWSLRHYRDGT